MENYEAVKIENWQFHKAPSPNVGLSFRPFPTYVGNRQSTLEELLGEIQSRWEGIKFL